MHNSPPHTSGSGNPDAINVAILPDAQARTAAIDFSRSFIVQAPAGSGKTELLTQRYLCLLARVEEPEQILAITFTRKAASEMRNRILQSLQRARATSRPDKAHEAHNWDLAQAALANDARCGWQIESNPVRLRIQTIDSLNASLSRRLPVLAGMGASMEIAQDQTPIYEAVCKRLLEQLGDGSPESKHLETVLLHLANRVPDFMSMLCDLLAKRDHWLPVLIQHRNDEDLRDSIERTLSAVVEHHLQGVLELLPVEMHAELVELANFSARTRLQDGDSGEALEYLANMAVIPAAHASEFPVWLALAGLVCKKESGRLKAEFYSRMDKRHGFPADKDKKPMKDRMHALLRDMNDIPDLGAALSATGDLPAPEFSDSQWQVLLALLQLLPRAVSELMLEFQSSGKVDYVEMSLRALQALGATEHPTDMALALDEHLHHILVDEFQDTSITQRRLLELLTAGWSESDGRTLFCVGDPMQSIYRFRQAEVGLFLEMQQHGLSGLSVQPLSLKTNFRSTQTIVDWVNASFPHIMPARDDAEQGAVHYSASLPRPDASREGIVKVHAAIDQTPQQEAIAIRSLVQQSLNADSKQRIAILVSGRTHVGPIAQELKQTGIAFNAVDIERLEDRSLVQDLMALTRALVHLGDRTAWLACLRAPWCGASLSDLHALAAHDAEQTIYSLLNVAMAQNPSEESDSRFTHDGKIRLSRFTAIINAAIAQRSRYSLRDWVEQTWLSLNGPACLSESNELEDADSYFTRLDELEVAGDLEDLTRLEEQLSSLYAKVHSGDNDVARVDIMTIHKSKGLEFDVVILPSLHRGRGKDNDQLLRWTRLTGLPADGLVLAPPGAKGEDGDSIYQWLAQLEKQRARYESQRLLYVATTRARRELHLFGSVSLNKTGDAPASPKSGCLLALLWPQVEAEYVRAVVQRIPQSAATVAASSVSLKRLPLHWTAPEPVENMQGNYGNAVINSEVQPEFDWVGETSRHIGTVVHAELERLVKLSAAEMQVWNADARKPHLLLKLAELGVPEKMRNQACDKVIQAVRLTLNDSRGRWILGLDTQHQDADSEIALSGIVNGKVFKNIIDRSFVDDTGTRWIIDFKTSSHEGGGLDEFLGREVERYRYQLERYAQLMQAWKPANAIRTALYFPLLSAWREVI